MSLKHIMVTQVVEQRRGATIEFHGAIISACRQIEATKLVIRGRKSGPRRSISGIRLDSFSKMLLCQTVPTFTEVLSALPLIVEKQALPGASLFYVNGASDR